MRSRHRPQRGDPAEPMRCIYCRQWFKRSELSREHIIAKGLGGTAVLEEASCKACQAVTANQIERDVLRGMLQYVRGYFGYPNDPKKGKRPVTTRHVRGRKNGEWIEAEVHTSELTLGAVPRYDEVPRLLTPDVDPGKEIPYGMHRIDGPKTPTHGIDEFVPTKMVIPVGLFNRMLAKIAHAYACKYVGIDSFKPLLCELILGPGPKQSLYIGAALVAHASLSDHSIAHRWERVGAEELLVVTVRLFRPCPTYQIVVGRRSPSC